MTPQELADLDFAVAHAEGIVDELEATDREGTSFLRRSAKQKPGAAPVYETWSPTRDHGLAMRLLEKHGLDLKCVATRGWYCGADGGDGTMPSPTPMVAICRAVVALKAA